jgi:TatA/E family protein of Tat protein translocase
VARSRGKEVLAVGFGGIGASELVVIVLIALLIFGPSRLAEVGASLGKAIRDFRKAMQEANDRES